MVQDPIRTSADLPDEYGLSSDSLRGSHQFVQPHLVDADDSRDPLTGRPNPRAPLSRNEIRALEDKGMLVDENGYEREPEPVVVAAPVPMAQPRVRRQDRAPAGETLPTPHRQIPFDDSTVPISEDPTWRHDVNESPAPSASIAPYSGGIPTPTVAPYGVDAERDRANEQIRQDRERAERQINPPVNPTTESD